MLGTLAWQLKFIWFSVVHTSVKSCMSSSINMGNSARLLADMIYTATFNGLIFRTVIQQIGQRIPDP